MTWFVWDAYCKRVAPTYLGQWTPPAADLRINTCLRSAIRVSIMTMSHFAGIEQVMGKTPEEVRLQTSSKKQAETMRTWRGAAGRSRCGQSTAVYGGPAVMSSAPIVSGFWSGDPQAGRVRRPDTSAPSYYCMNFNQIYYEIRETE